MGCYRFKRPFCKVFCRGDERYHVRAMGRAHEGTGVPCFLVAFVDHECMVDDIVDVLHQILLTSEKSMSMPSSDTPDTSTTSPSISASNR